MLHLPRSSLNVNASFRWPHLTLSLNDESCNVDMCLRSGDGKPRKFSLSDFHKDLLSTFLLFYLVGDHDKNFYFHKRFISCMCSISYWIAFTSTFLGLMSHHIVFESKGHVRPLVIMLADGTVKTSRRGIFWKNGTLATWFPFRKPAMRSKNTNVVYWRPPHRLSMRNARGDILKKNSEKFRDNEWTVQACTCALEWVTLINAVAIIHWLETDLHYTHLRTCSIQYQRGRATNFNQHNKNFSIAANKKALRTIYYSFLTQCQSASLMLPGLSYLCSAHSMTGKHQTKRY